MSAWKRGKGFSLQTVNINTDYSARPALTQRSNQFCLLIFSSFPPHNLSFFIMCNEAMKVESELNSTHTLMAQA